MPAMAPDIAAVFSMLQTFPVDQLVNNSVGVAVAWICQQRFIRAMVCIGLHLMTWMFVPVFFTFTTASE